MDGESLCKGLAEAEEDEEAAKEGMEKARKTYVLIGKNDVGCSTKLVYDKSA